MIELLGGLMINPRLVESVNILNEAGRPFETLQVKMASGFVHVIQHEVAGRSVREIYDEIMRGAA